MHEVNELQFFDEFLSDMEAGHKRAAFKDSFGNWKADLSVKKIILNGFKNGKNVSIKADEFCFIDKDTFPLQKFSLDRNIRIAPGGTSVRRGSYIAPSVVIMPPAYVNVGAYIDEYTMVDSHSLVGSCSQIGKRVHLSAGAQIGGVLEPVGALPVVIENNVFVGGNAGIYEGTIVRDSAVIGAGVVLTRSVTVFDIVNEKVISAKGEGSLIIPPGAVVVSGARPVIGEFASRHGLCVYSAIIIKYRDEKTDIKSCLEAALR